MADHRTAPISDFDAKDGDLFIAMEPYQVEAVRRQEHWTAAHQVTLLGLWVDGHGAVLLDPYGQDEQSFAECFSVIEAGILVMKGRIAKE